MKPKKDALGKSGKLLVPKLLALPEKLALRLYTDLWFDVGGKPQFIEVIGLAKPIDRALLVLLSGSVLGLPKTKWSKLPLTGEVGVVLTGVSDEFVYCYWIDKFAVSPDAALTFGSDAFSAKAPNYKSDFSDLFKKTKHISLGSDVQVVIDVEDSMTPALKKAKKDFLQPPEHFDIAGLMQELIKETGYIKDSHKNKVITIDSLSEPIDAKDPWPSEFDGTVASPETISIEGFKFTPVAIPSLPMPIGASAEGTKGNLLQAVNGDSGLVVECPRCADGQPAVPVQAIPQLPKWMVGGRRCLGCGQTAFEMRTDGSGKLRAACGTPLSGPIIYVSAYETHELSALGAIPKTLSEVVRIADYAGVLHAVDLGQSLSLRTGRCVVTGECVGMRPHGGGGRVLLLRLKTRTITHHFDDAVAAAEKQQKALDEQSKFATEQAKKKFSKIYDDGIDYSVEMATVAHKVKLAELHAQAKVKWAIEVHVTPEAVWDCPVPKGFEGKYRLLFDYAATVKMLKHFGLPQPEKQALLSFDLATKPNPHITNSDGHPVSIVGLVTNYFLMQKVSAGTMDVFGAKVTKLPETF